VDIPAASRNKKVAKRNHRSNLLVPGGGVYFPLENIDGHPLLRIMEPTNAVNIRISNTLFQGFAIRERRDIFVRQRCRKPDYEVSSGGRRPTNSLYSNRS
jgi:hypothetical protein